MTVNVGNHVSHRRAELEETTVVMNNRKAGENQRTSLRSVQ